MIIRRSVDGGRRLAARSLAIAGLRRRRRRRWSARRLSRRSGVSAPYLIGDVIGGRKARAAKMRAAKIRPLSAGMPRPYMAELERELRSQTAGIGLDVLQVGGGIVIRIPATFTFDAAARR